MIIINQKKQIINKNNRLKPYFSILIYFIFLVLLFNNNMAFATSCSEIDERASLDYCRNTSFDIGNVDMDGNKPITKNNIGFNTFNPYTNPEYFYDKRNKYCLMWSIGISLSYSAFSISASLMCNRAGGTDSAEKGAKISKIRKVIKTLNKARKILGKTRGFVVDAAIGTVAGVFTDPIITLQIELALDMIPIGWNITLNSFTCASSAGTSGCVELGLCVAASSILSTVVNGLIFTTTGTLYALAEDQINKVKLCGYDWENYVYTKYDLENYSDEEIYPQKGAFSNSYSYKLDKCFKYGEVKAKSDYGVDCSEVTKDYCDLGDKQCEKISISSKDIRNRLYRETLNKGKEFKISTDYFSEKCIDPRPEWQKGFSGLEQRYYFRGSESAHYLCNRFKFYNQGCVLENETIEANELNEPTKKAKCKQAFEEAYSCCKNRAALGVCMYNVEDNDSYGRDTENNTMCLRQLNANDSVEECEVKTSGITDPKFIAFTPEDNVGKICVQNTNFCPYSYNLDGGTIAKDEFCEGDYSCSYSTCDLKYSGDEDKKRECENKMFDEIEKIWHIEGNSKIPTPSYGQIKNFLSYNAHCTDIGDVGKIGFVDMPENKYFPKVCSDFVGDSKNLPIPLKPVDLNSPITEYLVAGVDFDLGQYRGFTAPIAQCFKETLSNMFNNRAGISLCKDPNEEINADGLCGGDSFEDLTEQVREERYYYVIGDKLPDDQNIFYKIQSRLQLIIKLFAVLAIIVIGINFLLKGDLNIFGDLKKSKALVLGIVKFALVFYFAVGSAWQTYFYKWIDDSIGYLYRKVYELSLLNYEMVRNKDTELTCTKQIYNAKTCPKQEFLADGVYFIPNNVDSLKLEVYGASGGKNGLDNSAKGGYSYGRLNLDSNKLNIKRGDILYVKIGKSGGNTNAGGGATDIRVNNSENLTCDKNDPRIIVAGGGGGAGNSSGNYTWTGIGGAGGGGKDGIGANGSSYDDGAYGSGATSIIGGIGGKLYSANNILYKGNNGICGFGGKGNGQLSVNDACLTCYGDGGDGWYGGGGSGGGHAGGSGGGGSGYISSSLINVGGIQGGNIEKADGYAVITTYNNNSDICFDLHSKTENFVVKDKTIFEDQTITEKCFTNDNIKTCYKDCILRDKTDSSNNTTYKWDEKYDGCYFGDAKYPEGKSYLALFDSLDCKLMNYFKYTPDIDLPGIIVFVLLSLLWSPLAVSIVLLGFIFFIIMLSIAIKIFYVFLMSFFAINILIYISPIVFPTLLFKKYKNVFDTWLNKLIGYSLQLIFVVIFAGFVITTLDKIALGNNKYINHDPVTGRLPIVNCNETGKLDSLICLFDISLDKSQIPAFGNTLKKIFGIGPMVGSNDVLSKNFIQTVILLLKSCLVLYVLLQFMKKMNKVISEITGTGALEGGNIGIKETLAKVKEGLDTGARVARYSAITAKNTTKRAAVGLKDKAVSFGKNFGNALGGGRGGNGGKLEDDESEESED